MPRLLIIGLVALIGCVETPVEPPLGLHLHRLNASEYANSLEAVLGVESQVAKSLPADAPSHGFDNIAAVLTTGPLSVELYAQATDEVLDAALEPAGRISVELEACEGESTACAHDLLQRLTTLAWRRPPTDAELHRVFGVFASARELGLEVDESVAAALRAVLLSPHFLFRIEATAREGERVPLDGYELASRLSYFLWSGPPDDALLADAGSGALLDADVLEAHARRMLADPRASALADGFAAQWLGYRYLEDVFKDTARYPDFTPTLRESMANEPRLFVLDAIAHDRAVHELLTSEYSFVDPVLADLYGLEQSEPGFVRIATGPARRGLLTQAGLLSTLAYPFTTSPARRGAWVLGNLLCVPPSAPPPGVDVPIDEDPADKAAQLEAHRATPACASCHESIDPIGLAFEGYDAIGEFRTEVDGVPIETAGSLPSGVGFADPIEMASAIAEDPAFVPCAVQQTLIYALGRGLESREHDEIERLAVELGERGFGMQELFVVVATSEAFRTRVEESP